MNADKKGSTPMGFREFQQRVRHIGVYLRSSAVSYPFCASLPLWFVSSGMTAQN
jgi:hypothetical protein